MADRNLPTPEELRNLLDYDPETGILNWRSGRRRRAGYVKNEYRKVEVLGVCCGEHRVAWAIAHGEWPKHTIDHINGIKGDNRLANLRDVPNAENQKNRPKQANNTSGCTGVYWHKPTQRWRAKVKIDGWWKWLGNFEHKFDAVLTRLIAERDFGYTMRHGLTLNPAAK